MTELVLKLLPYFNPTRTELYCDDYGFHQEDLEKDVTRFNFTNGEKKMVSFPTKEVDEYTASSAILLLEDVLGGTMWTEAMDFYVQEMINRRLLLPNPPKVTYVSAFLFRDEGVKLEKMWPNAEFRPHIEDNSIIISPLFIRFDDERKNLCHEG